VSHSLAIGFSIGTGLTALVAFLFLRALSRLSVARVASEIDLARHLAHDDGQMLGQFDAAAWLEEQVRTRKYTGTADGFVAWASEEIRCNAARGAHKRMTGRHVSRLQARLEGEEFHG
jgi:hypothetical protein